ncbi:hypothetical protein HCN51_43870 [Nonomuraea sp. FMUSA5-5]|uniref:Transposase n=1 Tax=Nonomuraea composti TaxID=2720023 RepID=A0ABX1BJ09_9ACTN|nr:hypothetical protein [Nonomuraea sp. FMUSA5-5]NJP96297.1 hypothetical protein [Nonomuraea sp. FMUSA5-5]
MLEDHRGGDRTNNRERGQWQAGQDPGPGHPAEFRPIDKRQLLEVIGVFLADDALKRVYRTFNVTSFGDSSDA